MCFDRCCFLLVFASSLLLYASCRATEALLGGGAGADAHLPGPAVPAHPHPPLHGGGAVQRDVALQVEFDRQTLKPVFSLDRL
jgi:hypothetical protein